MEGNTEINSKYIQALPGMRIAFVIKPLPEAAANGHNFTSYLCPVGDWWTAIDETDKFLSLELLAAKGLNQLRLAVIVEGEILFNNIDPL